MPYLQPTRLTALLLFLALSVVTPGAIGCGGESNLYTNVNQSDGGDDDDNRRPDAGQDVGRDTGPGVDSGPSPDSGGQDTGPVDPCLQTTPSEAATFATDFATRLCERMLTCSQNPQVAQFVSFGGWSSVEHCAQNVQAGTLSAGQARQAATEGSLTLDSCAASDCLQLIPTLDCMGIHRALTEARYSEMQACYDAWEGRRAQGRSCTVDAECEGEQVCARDDASNTCAGTCADAGQSGSGQCGDIVCRADQYCSTDNNICMTRKAPGGACQDDFECTLDGYCDGGTCTAIASGRTDGQSCDGQTQICSLDLACLGGQCSSFLSAGDSCQLFGCQADLFCNQGGTCEARRDGGQSCDSDQQCQSLRCANGACTDSTSLCP